MSHRFVNGNFQGLVHTAETHTIIKSWGERSPKMCIQLLGTLMWISRGWEGHAVMRAALRDFATLCTWVMPVNSLKVDPFERALDAATSE